MLKGLKEKVLGSRTNESSQTTQDDKLKAVAGRVDDVMEAMRGLKNDARNDICQKGKEAFDKVISSMGRLAAELRGETIVREPSLDQATTPEDWERARRWARDQLRELERQISEKLDSTPPARLKAEIGRLFTAALGRIGTITLASMR